MASIPPVTTVASTTTTTAVPDITPTATTPLAEGESRVGSMGGGEADAAVAG
jgi:hypothetical protein